MPPRKARPPVRSPRITRVCGRAWRPTCPSVPTFVIVYLTGSPDPRHALRARAQPVSGQLSTTTRRRAGHIESTVSCRLSTNGIRSRVILSRPGAPPSLVGLPGHERRDPHGVSMFHTCEYHRVGCPLDPGDGGALLGRMPCPTDACRFSLASPYTRTTSHRRSHVLRGINRGSRDSPVRPAPCLTPGWNDTFGLSLVLRTPLLPADARQRRSQA